MSVRTHPNLTWTPTKFPPNSHHSNQIQMHYLNSICSLGSADGYNMESPEQIHIEFTKDAYRASNKCDYVEQTALWLQQHEAIWLRESYLIWIEKRVGVRATEVSEDSDGDVEDVIDDQLEHRGNVTTKKHAESEMDFSTKNYSLAKQLPYQNITVDNIISKFGAIDFISALSTFLCHNFPGTTVLPSIYDRFNAYKQLTIQTPQNHYLSEHKQTD